MTDKTPEETRSTGSSKVEDIATFREFREYARGNLDVPHSDVHPIAGLVSDESIRDVLAFMAESYQPRSRDMPASFWETDFARRAVRKFATDRATTAVSEGNISQTAYFSGLPSYDSDISGLRAINSLSEWLIHSEKCKLIYIAALMGRGKTDLALLFMEVIDDHYRRISRSVEVDRPEFAANLRVEPSTESEVRLIDSFPELLEWAESGSSSDSGEANRWFIFDEASSELTAQSGAIAQKVSETMAPFVKKMRKKGVNMIVIGHDKGDIHPAVRSMADYVDKTGLKTATFYSGIKKREPVGELFSVSGIPPTSWEFDTDDLASWDWGIEEESEEISSGMSDDEFRDYRNERIASVYLNSDLNQREVGDAFDVSQGTVTRVVSEFKEENGLDDGSTNQTATAD